METMEKIKPLSPLHERMRAHNAAAALRKYAVKKKMDQKAIAEALGIPERRSTVRKWLAEGMAPRAQGDIEMLERFTGAGGGQ